MSRINQRRGKPMAKYKHLTLSERVEIYTLLKANKSIRKIAKELSPVITCGRIKNVLNHK